MNVPKVSMSITVLKALKDKELAGHRKFPAAPAGRKDTRMVQEPWAVRAYRLQDGTSWTGKEA